MSAWMSERKMDMSAPLIGGDSGALYYAGGRWVAYRGAVIEHHSATSSFYADWITGCAFMMRTALFHALSGFDERFFLYSEDVDLSLRARDAGARLGVFPKRLVEHPRHGYSTDKLGEKKQEIAFTSRGRLIALHVPKYARWLALAIQGIVVPLRSRNSLQRTTKLARSMFLGYRASRRVTASK